MQCHRAHTLQKAIALTLLALAVPAWWWVYHPVQPMVLDPALFLFFHNAVEIFAVVVAALVFLTGYRAVLSARNGAVVLMGVGFLGVALLDALHTMSYAGMPDAISANSPQKAAFFWLCARMLAAVSILVYASLPRAPELSTLHKRLAALVMLSIVAALAFFGLLWPDRLPQLFVAGQGLTPLKIRLEWAIIAVHLLTLLVLWLRRVELVDECAMALGFAVALSIASESFFTILGVNGIDVANMLGHLYKVAAYLYLFHATFNEAINRPLQRLSAQHLREQQVLNAAPDGILWVNQSGLILMTNPAVERLTGYAKDQLLGQNVDIFLPEHQRERHGADMRGYFIDPHGRTMGCMDVQLQRQDGSMLPVDISLGHWEDKGQSYAIAYIRDLTERKGFEESLRHRATHDELTGLPNRWMFNLQLSQALTQAKRTGRHVAVLMLDLDDFKTVNDSFGHAVGDELLVLVSQRLGASLRQSDTLARLGGDEFAILLADMQSTDEAMAVAAKLIATMGKTYTLIGQEIHSSGSIGIAFYPGDGQNADALLRFADMAMYQAKRSVHGSYACYSPQFELRAQENMRVQVRLKEALDNGRLRLFYQPKMAANGETMLGAEALLRWHDDELGDVSPARFIPVAESTGLILPISAWVLETACQQIAAWHRAGTPLQVAVNFSAQQFRQGNVADQVRAVLQRTGAPAHLLEIEITESIAMEQPEAAHAELSALVALGCTVALDDFGTGYSSLAYLKSLPVSVLKIDRTFVKDIAADQGDAKICRAIIALAHSLDMTLVAEGVETPSQLAFLRNLGCEVYQGWLFAKAMPVSELTARLLESRDRHEFDFEAIAQ
ncbi:putative bifunctional diguanylate cyclase/phosphodiesterase [Rhodoferax antarcticus]|uniref:Diguanylate cyclase/phosphodiesterase with PAS/PAC sensor n=1 Tax=Rhodoferax antarcticus ANT.BR TaxID=1111071 RepID=A0A1Q8YK13_9BURK|nr:EAL domain-containing protein [Rhodoferax antarcticus]APW47730.1 hypothetical protein RA876_16800 [Rhodoferax antarcticus]OLP08269.1 Diguanylate cyclase/phosphodiesterase with PAS/PAC sensor [Rhodoferax antarcticus ANT.BR]